ncbi:MAG: phage holin [Clostridiales bacterium]|nr:phage holin [Clostridiales bacterium]
MNWKVRAKNPQFWVQIILALVAPVLAYFGLTGADFTTWAMVGQTFLSAIANPYVVILALVSVWNALQDPTTAGVSDSAQALTYTIPKPQKVE